jgi:branched-chain amino acid transport system ATP-binding protein
MEALRFEHVCMDFGGVHALNDVSFRAGVGERIAIIGPNGAGKTTLINILDGQLFPSSGRIYLFTRDITSLPTYQRTHLGIGRSFQVTSLFPKMTVLENLLLAMHGSQPSRYRMFRVGTAKRDAITGAHEFLETWDLSEERNSPVSEISYGSQRKLEIVMSLVCRPRVLLLDEPSNGLTAAESAEIVAMISNMDPEVSVVVVAHDMDLVFGVAQRIIVLHYGKIIADDSPDRILMDSEVRKIYIGKNG